jgi:hypothetical protein
VLAVAWAMVTLFASGTLFFGNFVVAWQAFDFVGFEPQPLFNVPLLGPLAAALGVGDAQLASLYAAVLTTAMAVTVIGAVKLGNEALTLFFDLRQARLAGGTDTAAGLVKFSETAVSFLILAGLAIAVARYDVSLFDLRLQALLTGVEDIQEGLGWESGDASRLGGFLADFASRARWGYLAIIGGVAFVTDKAFQRAAERWLVIGQTIDAAIAGAPGTRPAPIASRAPGPVPPRAGAAERAEARPSTPARRDPSPAPVSEPARAAPRLPPQRARPESPRGPVSQPADVPMTAESVVAAAAVPRVRVVWGPGEIQEVPLAEVERDQSQYVRDGSGRTWFRRSYYEQLITGSTNVEKEPEATMEEPAHV